MDVFRENVAQRSVYDFVRDFGLQTYKFTTKKLLRVRSHEKH